MFVFVEIVKFLSGLPISQDNLLDISRIDWKACVKKNPYLKKIFFIRRQVNFW